MLTSIISISDVKKWRARQDFPLNLMVRKLFLPTMLLLLCQMLHAQQPVLLGDGSAEGLFVNCKPSKEAKKEAKEMMKAGWGTEMGSTPMDEQLMRSFLLQSVMMDDGSGGSTSRYIIATAEAKNKSEEVAQARARAFCEAQIAQSLNVAITSLIEHEVKTQQHSATEAQTQEEIRQRTESMSQSCLQMCSKVCCFIKKESNGQSSVQMTLAFDKASLRGK